MNQTFLQSANGAQPSEGPVCYVKLCHARMLHLAVHPLPLPPSVIGDTGSSLHSYGTVPWTLVFLAVGYVQHYTSLNR